MKFVTQSMANFNLSFISVGTNKPLLQLNPKSNLIHSIHFMHLTVFIRKLYRRQRFCLIQYIFYSQLKTLQLEFLKVV
jgi:hypothetical protein